MSTMRVWDQAYMKQRNIHLVLSLLRERQPLSRAEIARIADISPTSVTRIVGALLSLDLVTELGESKPNGRGRKAINLQINEKGIYTIGVSVEPHRVAAGLLDFGDNLLYIAEGPAPLPRPHDPLAFATVAHEIMGRIPSEHATLLSQVKAVGVCVSGVIDSEQGNVQQSDQLGWTGKDIASVFRSVFKAPVYVENDVNACLIGEKARKAIPQDEELAYLLIGTGVGAAAMVNGKVLRGWGNGAGEIGRVSAPNGGMLQDHLVERALVKRAQTLEPDVRSMHDIMQAYRLEIGWARMLISDFRYCLLSTLEMIAGLYSPKTCILGGSLAEYVQESVGESRMEESLSGAQVRIGEDYGVSCITGAAIFAQQRAAEVMISQEMETVSNKEEKVQ